MRRPRISSEVARSTIGPSAPPDDELGERARRVERSRGLPPPGRHHRFSCRQRSWRCRSPAGVRTRPRAARRQGRRRQSLRAFLLHASSMPATCGGDRPIVEPDAFGQGRLGRREQPAVERRNLERAGAAAPMGESCQRLQALPESSRDPPRHLGRTLPGSSCRDRPDASSGPALSLRRTAGRAGGTPRSAIHRAAGRRCRASCGGGNAAEGGDHLDDGA